jgi:hypothetical protein
MMDEKLEVKASKHIYLFFILAAVSSFLYSIFTGKLNGDFLGVEVKLDFWILLLNLLFTILPFWLLWKVYLYFKKNIPINRITIPANFLGFFLVFIIVWNVIVTILYGVGVMGAPPYDAPPSIKPLIQIMNRFNYFYGVFIYVLLVSKKNKVQFLLVFMLLLLAYLRAGLGVFLYLGMLMYIKYFLEFNSIFKKYKIVVLACFFAFPLIFSQLYELRNKLRNQADSEVSSDLIFGVLAGRLSSFSDAALILQEAPYFVLSSQQLDPFYFQKQALGGVLSMNFMPEVRPETMLFKFYNEKSDDNVTYMAGTQGNLYISLFHSIPTFIFNFITIVLYVFITFYLFRLLRFNFSTELAFLLLLYVIMSGVSNEFAFLVFSVFVYLVLFLFVNLFKTI